MRVTEPDHEGALVQRRDVTRDERVRCVDVGNALEVDVGARELRTDVLDVVGHPPQDRGDDVLIAVAACCPVAMDLLDPLEVDDRHHADQEVGVPSDVDPLVDVPPVQTLVVEKVGAGRPGLPILRKSPAPRPGHRRPGRGSTGGIVRSRTRRRRRTAPRAPREGWPRGRSASSGDCPSPPPRRSRPPSRRGRSGGRSHPRRRLRTRSRVGRSVRRCGSPRSCLLLTSQ